MKAARYALWISLATLAFVGGREIWFATKDSAFQLILHACLWPYLTIMLYRRPKSWGLGIGVFLLIVIALQLALWRAALRHPQRIELGISDSWMRFLLSEIPLSIGAISALSLRWLFPAKA